MKYQVKELGVGEILDQAALLLKNRFGLLLGITLVLLVPYLAVTGVVMQATQPVLPPQPTADDFAIYQRHFFRTFPFLFAHMAFYLLVLWPLTDAAITIAVANEYLGRSIKIGAAVRRTFRIALPFMGTALLYYLAIWGGSCLFLLPGAVFYFWFALWAQVVAVEGATGVDAMNRSKFLMKGNVGQLFVLGFLLTTINMALTMNAQVVPEPYLRVVVGAVVEGPILCFTRAAYVVFYFSCRSKAENFDLMLLADSVAAPSAELEASVSPLTQPLPG